MHIAALRQREADLKRLGPNIFTCSARRRVAGFHDSNVDLFFDYQKGKLGVCERWT